MAGMLALGLVGLEVRKGVTELPLSFEAINLEAIARFGTDFCRRCVAMGDRAGSFAGHYAGPLTQLEGLVNDRAYFEALTITQTSGGCSAREAYATSLPTNVIWGLMIRFQCQCCDPRLQTFPGQS